MTISDRIVHHGVRFLLYTSYVSFSHYPCLCVIPSLIRNAKAIFALAFFCHIPSEELIAFSTFSLLNITPARVSVIPNPIIPIGIPAAANAIAANCPAVLVNAIDSSLVIASFHSPVSIPF